MTDVASLGLAVDSSQIKEATLALKALPNAASAAERAAQKWGMATDAAGNSAVEFSKRAQAVVRNLEFERAQLTRTTAEQERYAAVRRAGLSAASAQGQAIMASVAALQAQRAATKAAGDQHTITETATKAASNAATGLVAHLRGLVAAYVGVEAARKLWEIGKSAGDLGEQAEQIGINTDQLQAYRLAGAQAGIESEQMDTSITKLARSMGAANDGNKEMIELFQRLKVNLLDANGQLRPTADALPEVARGILSVGSSSQRTADLMTLFGRSGAKMTTVLQGLASGNDALIQSARNENAIISPQAIERWDKLGDSMKVAQQRFSTLVGEFGADIALPAIEHLRGLLEGTKKELEAIRDLWKWIMSNMDAAKRADVRAGTTPGQNDVQNLQDRLAAEKQRLQMNPNNTMAQSSVKALEGQLAARQEAASRMAALANQTVFQMDEADARRGTLPASMNPLGVTEGGTKGVGNPVAKGQVEAYQKIVDGARQYVAMKNIETQALGMNAEAAARLKHEQELLGKATEGGITLGAAQTAQLKGLAAAMAEADDKFKSAKFMDDANDASRKFIAAQEVERQTLFMSAEAAMAYRIEQELLTKAANDNITVTAAQAAELRQLAQAQAAAAEKTRVTKEWVDLGKETFRGFFSDINQGLREGANVWDIFGNAASNALNRISDKLMQMATDQLFEAAFPKGGAGGGGIGGFLAGLFGGGGGGANAGGFADLGSGAGMSAGVPNFMGMANGGVFAGGNVVPFARGGIVNRPTLFPFANGTGLMGEAGPEAIMPLRRGPGGRLGVSMHGNDNRPIVIQVAGDSEFIRVTARDEAVQVVKTAAPGIESRAVSRAKSQVVPTMDDYHRERGGDYRAG